MPIIDFTQPKSRNQSKTATFLDQVSSLLLEPKTVLTKGIKEGGRVARRRREDLTRSKDPRKALDVVGETLAATAIGAGLILGAANPAQAARVVGSVIPKTLRGKVALGTGAGVLASSKFARDQALGFIEDPTKTGRRAGEFIDKTVQKGRDSDFVQSNIPEALRDIAPVAVGAGLVAGGIGGISRVVDKIRTPSDSPSSVALPTDNVPTATDPISSGPVVATPVKAVPSPTAMPEVNIKVINKPQVNVAVAQSI